MSINRRDFIKTSGGLALGFAGLRAFVHAGSTSKPTMLISKGYGPLMPDPNKVFDLPKGFSYKILATKGQTMDDGFILPAMTDGMAAFPGTDGKIILVINHENSDDSDPKDGPFGEKNELFTDELHDKVFDKGKSKPMLGGTSTLVYDPKKQEVVKHYLSLAGTERNCAGGPTPWGSWITCEETTTLAGDDWLEDHGYNFEVPAKEDIGLVDPVPLKAMGRFRHEAVAIDPATSIVYQTEDTGNGLITRFIPNVKKKLHKGGKLQALAIKGMKTCDTRNWPDLKAPKFPAGEALDVEWIDLEDVESPNEDLRLRGQEKGAAIFARGEGMWYGNDEIYFACTNGGPVLEGQIFRYKPSPYEGTEREAEQPGKLELFVESEDAEILSKADNLTVANWGDLYIAEDTYDARFCKLVGVTPEGACYDFAQNSYNSSELAGVCFSPDGQTMFVNIQVTGHTLAITGPWDQKA